MNKKSSNIIKIIIILIAIILLVLVFFLTNKKGQEDMLLSPSADIEKTAEDLDKASQIEDDGDGILLIPKDDVYSFSITDAHGILLDFKKIDGIWVYADDDSLSINQDRIDKVLNYITDIKFIDVINATDGEAYGLNQESKMYIISDANNNSTIISIGNVDEENDTVYFALNYDFTNIYVNNGKLYNIGEYTIEDLVE